jgi:hypothetical protein
MALNGSTFLHNHPQLPPLAPSGVHRAARACPAATVAPPFLAGTGPGISHEPPKASHPVLHWPLCGKYDAPSPALAAARQASHPSRRSLPWSPDALMDCAGDLMACFPLPPSPYTTTSSNEARTPGLHSGLVLIVFRPPVYKRGRLLPFSLPCPPSQVPRE